MRRDSATPRQLGLSAAARGQQTSCSHAAAENQSIRYMVPGAGDGSAKRGRGRAKQLGVLQPRSRANQKYQVHGPGCGQWARLAREGRGSLENESAPSPGHWRMSASRRALGGRNAAKSHFSRQTSVVRRSTHRALQRPRLANAFPVGLGSAPNLAPLLLRPAGFEPTTKKACKNAQPNVYLEPKWLR